MHFRCARCPPTQIDVEPYPRPTVERSERPSWDEVNMEIAKQVARRSTCTHVVKYGGVGAVLVERDSHRFLGVGYCGSLPGQPHCLDVGCLVIEGDPGCHRTVHAEMNALLFARESSAVKTLYTTLSPCLKCLQHAIVKGVRRIVFATQYRIHEPQEELCGAAGVEWVKYPPEV
jgi:dCMP deaminase